jgi:predicted GNAT family acetyltransferase
MIKVVHNTKAQQFEVHAAGELSELDYRMRGNTMFFLHTWVPKILSGQGIASALAKSGLDFARANGHRIAVICPFVGAYLKRHPEYRDLLDPAYHQR